MAQRPSVVVSETTAIPDPSDVERVAAFAHEPFVCEGESPEDVLAAGTVRRHAFEFARAELDAGATVPSQKWRRRWSLLLGLDRALHTETPALADGTTLNPHQVDALSGTYAALLADAQRRTRGAGASDGDALLLSFEDDEGPGSRFHDEPPPQVAAPEEDEDDEPDDDLPDEPAGTDEFAAVPAAAADDEDEDDDEERPSLEDELEELPDAEPESESASYDDEFEEEVDEDVDAAALDDPNAHKRFWFEHATGAGKTVAAMGFVEACRTGGVLILTHRRNLVDQFIAELQTRGYGERLSKPLLGDADIDDGDPAHAVVGPVTIETYQWFVRNAGQISGAYTVVICDEAHTALGEKTSATIRAWTGPIFIGMTATGALIARHVTDLFPTQTSRFDLAQAARRGVIAPLRSLRIPPGPGVRTIAKVPLRKGEVDMEFDQDELAKLLDQAPFNLAIADLYKTRFRNTPGVVYTAGVKHAYNVAESFRALGMKAEAVSGETPKRELAKILADYEAGDIDVLVNAQLLAEGWNSPRATICMHLAPTASKRIYQQRVGRVTRRHPGKEAGVVIDFVHPATGNDDPVVTLHSLLDRDVYRGGAIVVGPVRRGRGRRVKVERRVLPVTPDIERRRDVFERELWRIAVEQLDWGEQRIWAALAGAKATPTNWRRGRAMLNFDRSGELRRQFLITALERNKNSQLRMRAIQEIAVLREADPFDTAIDFVGQWPRDERREASRVLLQAMADRRIGRREQATAWIWRLAEYTRDMHEEYAAQRWPATKHLLGLLVNSSGAAHARNARRLVHAARQHDRRLQAALLAAAVAHTPEAEEVLREARTRLARKPGALSRDLLKDFPSGKRRKKRSRNKKRNGGEDQGTLDVLDGQDGTTDEERQPVAVGADVEPEAATFEGGGQTGGEQGGGQGTGSRRTRSRRGRSRGGRRRGAGGGGEGQGSENGDAPADGDALVESGDASDGDGAGRGGRGGRQRGRGDGQQDGGRNGGRSNGNGRGGRGDGQQHGGGNGRGDGQQQGRGNGRGDGRQHDAGRNGSGAQDGTTDADARDAANEAGDEQPVRRRIRGQKAAEAAAAAIGNDAAAPGDEVQAPDGDRPAATDGTGTNGAAEPGAPRSRRRRRRTGGESGADAVGSVQDSPAARNGDAGPRSASADDDAPRSDEAPTDASGDEPTRPSRRRRRAAAAAEADATRTTEDTDRTTDRAAAGATAAAGRPLPARPVAAGPAEGTTAALTAAAAQAAPAVASASPDAEHPAKTRARARAAEAQAAAPAAADGSAKAAASAEAPGKTAAPATAEAPTKKAPATRRRTTKAAPDAAEHGTETPAASAPAKAPSRTRAKAAAADEASPAAPAKAPARRRTTKAAATDEASVDVAPVKAPARRRTTKAAGPEGEAPTAKAPASRTPKAAAATPDADAAAKTPRARAASGTAAKKAPATKTATTAADTSAAKVPATKKAPATKKPATTTAATTATAAKKAAATTAATTASATKKPAAKKPAAKTAAARKPAATATAAKPAATKPAAKKPAAKATAAKPAAKKPAAKATAAKKPAAKAAATKAAPKRATKASAGAASESTDAPATPATRRRTTTTKADETE